MAYYDALIADWDASSASPGALPTGVAGTSLYGLATADKITAINGWTVTGTIPTTFFTSGASIWNCINLTEFQGLSATNQQLIAQMCCIPGGLLGGSAETSFLTNGLIIANFNTGSTFTGSISGTTLTVTVAPSKAFVVGAAISLHGVAAGTTITAFGTGTGGTGTYTVSISQTVTSGTMLNTGPTIVALEALASAQVQLWWGVSVANGGGGLTGAVSQADVTYAGLS